MFACYSEATSSLTVINEVEAFYSSILQVMAEFYFREQFC